MLDTVTITFSMHLCDACVCVCVHACESNVNLQCLIRFRYCLSVVLFLSFFGSRLFVISNKAIINNTHASEARASPLVVGVTLHVDVQMSKQSAHHAWHTAIARTRKIT